MPDTDTLTDEYKTITLKPSLHGMMLMAGMMWVIGAFISVMTAPDIEKHWLIASVFFGVPAMLFFIFSFILWLDRDEFTITQRVSK